MFRRHLLPIAAFAAVLMLAFGYSLTPGRKAPPPGPKSLHEAGQIARTLGLHHRSDILTGEVTFRLIISTEPVTFELANGLHFGDINNPCWQNTVAACVPWNAYPYLADPANGVVWGEVFLFGDPALIRTLTTAGPAGPNARNWEELVRKNE
jgi:hypothetical protein